jgi:ATP-dependent Clp protease ATP-binding subunit ClpC
VGIAASVIVLGWTAVLLLSLTNITLFPSENVLSSVCWSLYVAAAATSVVLGYGTDPEVLNFWTPEVWQSFDVAHSEAVRFHHDFVGTEHLLLGLMQAEGSAIPTILGRMGVGCESVRAGIEKIVGSGGQSYAGQKIPYTPRAGKAFQLAIQEAQKGNSQRAGVEHLFLGLIREGGGVAAMVLKQLGVNLEDARKEVSRTSR